MAVMAATSTAAAIDTQIKNENSRAISTLNRLPDSLKHYLTSYSDLFVFTLLRHTTDGAWHRPAPESPRREARAVWLVDRYFERRALYARR